LAADDEAAAALREALFGNRGAAQKRAQEAITLSRGKRPEYLTALTYALAGDVGRSRELAEDLGRRFPQDTIVQFHWLPTVRALIELDQRNPTNAIQVLQAASPYELGGVIGALWPVYARGLAYLALHQGAEAAVEFQRILDNRGVVIAHPRTALIDALAHLGLARAYALQGDSVKARAAYQDLFTIWKDADPGILVLKEAQAEFKKLN
jgi:eukaryotic-like serine/threonine-protein kinase